MKPSSFALFFLFAFIASSAKAQVVLDAAGDFVTNGGTYYILPYVWALGGGLGLAATGNETSPLSVVQSAFEVDNGLPWRIACPLRILHVPTNFSLEFYSVEGKVPDSVPFPSRWSFVEGENGNKSVKISGFENPITGWFKIQQVDSWAYKIVFCSVNGDPCGDLGISKDDKGNRLLVINDDNPMNVVFFKAEPISEKVSQV
ncbi:hypothetical protein K1719_024180 [Acacia pycnantha]|nr:hypothetical protein K1719_024180 [Acacia pycnantha]